jgi:hypothetical protein
VISYKRGAPGSARRDRLGRARNVFTILWDNGWLTDEEVLAIAHERLRNERVAPPAAPPARRREHAALPSLQPNAHLADPAACETAA